MQQTTIQQEIANCEKELADFERIAADSRREIAANNLYWGFYKIRLQIAESNISRLRTKLQNLQQQASIPHADGI